MLVLLMLDYIWSKFHQELETSQGKQPLPVLCCHCFLGTLPFELARAFVSMKDYPTSIISIFKRIWLKMLSSGELKNSRHFPIQRGLADFECIRHHSSKHKTKLLQLLPHCVVWSSISLMLSKTFLCEDVLFLGFLKFDNIIVINGCTLQNFQNFSFTEFRKTYFNYGCLGYACQSIARIYLDNIANLLHINIRAISISCSRIHTSKAAPDNLNW